MVKMSHKKKPRVEKSRDVPFLFILVTRLALWQPPIDLMDRCGNLSDLPIRCECLIALPLKALLLAINLMLCYQLDNYYGQLIRKIKFPNQIKRSCDSGSSTSGSSTSSRSYLLYSILWWFYWISAPRFSSPQRWRWHDTISPQSLPWLS